MNGTYQSRIDKLARDVLTISKVYKVLPGDIYYAVRNRIREIEVDRGYQTTLIICD